MTLAQRFENRYIPVPESGCWLWLGPLDRDGYGHIWSGPRPWPAHRVSLELRGVEIPQGLVVDHLCRERSCVNPDHLHICTVKENTLAPHSKCPAVANLAKERCPRCRGEYSVRPHNTVRGGNRRCKSCENEQQRRRRAAKKEVLQ